MQTKRMISEHFTMTATLLLLLCCGMFLASCGKDTTGAEPWDLDEVLVCQPGTPARECYSGSTITIGQGVCKTGKQTCVAGAWGPCVGEVLPGEESCNGVDDDCDGEVDEEVRLACGLCVEEVGDAVEVCHNGADDDCDGEVDEECACLGPQEACYSGPPGTRGTGQCADGVQTCQDGVRGECLGSVTPTREICDDGIDNDCDDGVDEGCDRCLSTEKFIGQTRWQMHRGGGPVCWEHTYETHGSKEAFRMARIPEEEDRGWTSVSEQRISFNDRSSLCGDGPFDEPMCDCRKGGDYTYFQTFLELGENQTVENLQIDIANVDDGARVTIFNDQNPRGIVDPEGYVELFGKLRVNLARYLVTGTNRIVITHVDDCCSMRVLEGVRVLIDGVEIVECR